MGMGMSLVSPSYIQLYMKGRTYTKGVKGMSCYTSCFRYEYFSEKWTKVREPIIKDYGSYLLLDEIRSVKLEENIYLFNPTVAIFAKDWSTSGKRFRIWDQRNSKQYL